MLELILSAIFLLSPEDTTNVPFDISIIFEPPVDPKSIIVYLDEEIIKGEKDGDYFYKQINNIYPGEHTIKLQVNENFKEWRFIVIKKKDVLPLDMGGNLSLGFQSTYYRDTTYPEESSPIYGLDISFSKGEHFFNLSITSDPDYPSGWYPYLSYYGTKGHLEAGYIYPFLDELTIYSPGGFGVMGDIDIEYLSLTPFFLYSTAYDSLFAEYPRYYYGGKIGLNTKKIIPDITIYWAKDDTSEITGFTIVDPKQSLVISPELKWKMIEELSLTLKGGYSMGNNNLFTDTLIKGTAIEGELTYEKNFNNIKIGTRKVSEGYLILGNPYLYTNRLSLFLSGIYEWNTLYTDFDWLIYEKEGKFGLSLNQGFQLTLLSYFSPLLEYQWVKYPEFEGEEYQYGAVGFELMFGDDIRINNLISFNRYLSLYSTTSLNLSSNLYWYPADHSISIGGSISKESEYICLEVDLNASIKLWRYGYLEISYYPSIKEKNYEQHSLRIIYEYAF